MSTVLALPDDYRYVLASLASTSLVLALQTRTVGRNRKKAGIKYPFAYADKAEAEASPAAYRFNCAQRAHQNTLEVIPIIWMSTVIAGLKWPIPVASACAVWSVARLIYTRGYVLDGPEGRRPGSILSSVMTAGLLLASTYVAATFVLHKP